MAKSKTNTSHIFRLAVLIVAEILYLMFTNPHDVASVFLIVPFVLLFFIIFFAAIELIRLLRAEDEKVMGFSLQRPRLVGFLVAGFPVLLLILQSIGQLTWRDGLTAGALFLIAYFYVSRSSLSFFR
jgi:hypothetical protein